MEQQLLPVVVLALAVAGCTPKSSESSGSAAPQGVNAAGDGGATMKNAVVSPQSDAAPASPEPKATDGGGGSVEEHDAADSSPPDELPKETLVLHVGDSFAGALGIPLGLRFKAAGLRSVVKFETASYVPGWSSGKALPEYLEKYRPQLVLITLGANEIELVNPEQRAGTVRRLISRLDGRPCVWIKPPLWKEDTGIFRVIEQNAAPCRFLDSDDLVQNLERKRDKIHPSDEAREIWADAVFAWLLRERRGTEDRPWNLRSEPGTSGARRAPILGYAPGRWRAGAPVESSSASRSSRAPWSHGPPQRLRHRMKPSRFGSTIRPPRAARARRISRVAFSSARPKHVRQAEPNPHAPSSS